MATDLHKLIREVQSLPADQQRRLREVLDQNLAAGSSAGPTAEEQLEQQLFADGLLSEIKRPPNAPTACGRSPRVDIQGKPLSETVVEERR
ncbi:MAG: hypothetical protein WD847_09610 [Pirellulales bacterium]